MGKPASQWRWCKHCAYSRKYSCLNREICHPISWWWWYYPRTEWIYNFLKVGFPLWILENTNGWVSCHSSPNMVNISLKEFLSGFISSPIFQSIKIEMLDRIDLQLRLHPYSHSNTQWEHEEIITKDENKLKEGNLTLNKEKGEYRQKEIRFSGDIIRSQGRRRDEKKCRSAFVYGKSRKRE